MATNQPKSAIRGECRSVTEACGVERQAHVEEEMQYLTDTISNLETAQQTLFNRISTIVADEECCKDCEATPERYLVPLADRIRSLRYRVENLFNSAQSVTRRIEL